MMQILFERLRKVTSDFLLRMQNASDALARPEKKCICSVPWLHSKVSVWY